MKFGGQQVAVLAGDLHWGFGAGLVHDLEEPRRSTRRWTEVGMTDWDGVGHQRRRLEERLAGEDPHGEV